LSGTPPFAEFSPDAKQTFEVLSGAGALFFSEIVRQTRLLPSRVERALAELTAWGCVTADSFEGLRALLVPEEKRSPFGISERHRRNKMVTSADGGHCCESCSRRIWKRKSPSSPGEKKPSRLLHEYSFGAMA
jgi:hypothetical protein